jgi:hypothetical protein
VVRRKSPKPLTAEPNSNAKSSGSGVRGVDLRAAVSRMRVNYFPEPLAVSLCIGCFGSSLVMLRVCGVAAPFAVGLN